MLAVAIVGAGVIGSSIAYHLALRGVRVAVFDQAEPATEPSASWASAGGVRRQGRDPREWPLTLEASARWPALTQELGANTGFVPGGHLHVAELEADLSTLADRVARERAAGLDVHLLDAAQARAVAPLLGPELAGGAYTPGDGQADPRRTTRAFVAAAVRRGATFRTGAAVDGLLQEGERVVGLRIGAERVAAEWVVLAAGAWTAHLAAGVGLDLPLRPRAPQMLLTDAAPPSLTPTITAVGRPLSLKQLSTGEFFIGGGWPSDINVGPGAPPRLACRVRETSVSGSWAVATAVVPAVARQRIAAAWCGLEAQCFDGVPLIGPAPERPGLYLVAGFSGHGFQLSPAVGRAVAADLAGEDVLALAGLRPARTQQFDSAGVAAFKTEPTGSLEAGLLG